jgi:hypothetical protein
MGECLGGWGFGIRNQEGETLLQAACAFDLNIVNTFYKKKTEHLVTYKSGHHATQIDYFLVKRNRISRLIDCKVIPGECLVSKHRLLLLECKIRVKHSISCNKPVPKIRWYLLEESEYAEQFTERVISKIEDMKDIKDKSVNESWKELATCVRSVARDVMGETKGKGRTDKETWWWNGDVQRVLKEKKKAFKEWRSVEEGDERTKEN